MKPKFLCLLFVILFASNCFAQNLPSYLPANGLVGWWPFTGNANDSSGNSNNGVTYETTLTADRFGNGSAAYSFNGMSSRIEVPDALSLRCRKITLSAWVKSNILETKQVVYKGGLYAFGEAYSLFSYPGGSIKVNSNCVPGVGWHSVAGSNNIQQGEWEHLTLTYDSAILKIYKNGILIDSSTDTNGLIDDCTGGLRFGFNQLSNGSSGQPFDGFIDDIGIWNRALSAQEISHLHTCTPQTDCGYGMMGINVCTPKRNLHVKDVIRLEPRDTAPDNPEMGDIYFDKNLAKLKVYDGTAWQSCW